MNSVDFTKPRNRLVNQYKLKSIFGLNCGVYCFKNKINNKYYIGSSSNLRNRKSAHLNDLKNNKHHSIKFQRAYNYHGVNSFEYQVLECCEVKMLQQAETEWLIFFNAYNNGYNSTDEVGAPWRGKKQPEEIKKRQKCTPVKMVDPEGNVVKDYSVSNFCKQYKLPNWCIMFVLKGKYFQYKGWRNYSKELEGIKFNSKEYRKELGLKSNVCKNYKVINPSGEIVEGKNVTQMCKKYNLDAGAIIRVLDGKIKHHQGWRRFNKLNLKPFNWIGSHYRFQNETFSFKHTNGYQEVGIKLDDFCNKYNLKRGSIISLINKKFKTCKGWNVYVD
jgi:group I intron endonuclease